MFLWESFMELDVHTSLAVVLVLGRGFRVQKVIFRWKQAESRLIVPVSCRMWAILLVGSPPRVGKNTWRAKCHWHISVISVYPKC